MSKNQTVQALESAGLSFSCVMTNDPLPEGYGSGAHSWEVVLKYQGRLLTTPFFTGSAIGEVTAADVVSSLFLDSQATGVSFEDWCSDFGYDTDSRRAEATFKACQRSADKLYKLLRDDIETFAAIVQDH